MGIKFAAEATPVASAAPAAPAAAEKEDGTNEDVETGGAEEFTEEEMDGICGPIDDI